MIARPVTRPRPISYSTPAQGAKSTCPVSWAASSGPAPLADVALSMLSRGTPLLTSAMAPARRSPVRVAPPEAANDAANAPRQAQDRASGSSMSASLSKSSRAPSTFASKHKASAATGEMLATFMGHGSLSVRSSVTGRLYRFQGHGDCQKIDKHDMMMLRRIPDLVVC